MNEVLEKKEILTRDEVIEILKIRIGGITMYRIFTTFENDETDLIIRCLERMQLGYSDLILLAMENGWSEEVIVADIEDMVRRYFDDKTKA